jgi:serine/threonine protein kinase
MSERFQIIKELGRGGGALVHKAWDTRLHRHVAIKTVLSNSEITSDLISEASLTAGLNHPHIVSVYDVGLNSKGAFWVVMEFINGETLDQIIQRGPMSLEDFLNISTQVLDGLESAHRKSILHGDIKPTNIMTHFLANGTLQTKLVDFGLAKIAHRPILSDVDDNGAVCGTVHFMAPEQLRGCVLDVRSDLYSFGCVCYSMLAGRVPHEGNTMKVLINQQLYEEPEPLNKIRPDLPEAICDWVEWLMKKDADDRPPDSATALSALRLFAQGDYDDLAEFFKKSTTTRASLSKPSTRLVPTLHQVPTSAEKIDSKIKTQTPWPWVALFTVVGLLGYLVTYLLSTTGQANSNMPPVSGQLSHDKKVTWEQPAPVAFILEKLYVMKSAPSYKFGAWGEGIKYEQGGLRINEADNAGGLSYRFQTNWNPYAKMRPGLKMTIGPKNKALRVCLKLRSENGEMRQWPLDLQMIKVGVPTYVWAQDNATLSLPPELNDNQHPFQLDKITEIQVNGYWPEKLPIDIVIEEVIAVP